VYSPELFFEAAARRRQIRGIHQRHGVRLASATDQQSSDQVLIDPAQSAHAEGATEFVQHARSGALPAQAGKAPPPRLFGQLSDEQVEGMGGSQQRQQMGAPELGRAQSVTPPAGELAWTDCGDEVIRHIGTEHIQQAGGAHRRQNATHA
jgi:hypothetical protein